MTADPNTPLLHDVLASHESRLKELDYEEPVLQAFSGWLGYPAAQQTKKLVALAAEAASHDGAGRRYQDVATLGFTVGRLDPGNETSDRFRDGLQWMRGRRFFVPNQPLGFEADGLALLGVAVGIQSTAAPESEEARWLVELVQTSLARTHDLADATGEGWDASLFQASLIVLQHPAVESSDISRLAPDIAAALASCGFIKLNGEQELKARLAVLNSDSWRNAPLDRLLVQAVALRWLLRQAATALPGHASIEDVVTILAAVPHALKRWPWEAKPKTARAGAVAQRWDVQNEYHVQSMLWFLLAPLFPDLEDEEYLKSLGHKHPRVDLAIPSLGLIIEVKYLREGTQSALAGITSEISADTGFYLSLPSAYSTMVVFVWDNSRSTEHHAELLSALRVLPGVADAVVVSRPGGWEPRLGADSTYDHNAGDSSRADV